MSTLKTIRILNLNKQVLNAENIGENAILQLKSSLNLVMEIGLKLHKDNDGDAEYLLNNQARMDLALAGVSEVTDIMKDLSILRSDPSVIDNMINKYNFTLSEFNSLLDK